MRCLFKLAIAFSLAVLAQILVRPGGVGDEYLFAVRVAVCQNYLGMAPDSVELVNAAARLRARQGALPERCTTEAYFASVRAIVDTESDTMSVAAAASSAESPEPWRLPADPATSTATTATDPCDAMTCGVEAGDEDHLAYAR